MKEEIKKQLARCEAWLQEEPNDQEVIEKVSELKAQLERIEEKESKERYESEKKGMFIKIKALRKDIARMKRDLNKNYTLIEGFEDEMMALKEFDDELKKAKVEELNESIEEHNRLVKEYVKRYGEN